MSFPFIRNSFSNFRDFYFQFLVLLVYNIQPGTLKEVTFTLYGSFARTYRGHGTDRALLGGIMGFSTDDQRIPNLQFTELSGRCSVFERPLSDAKRPLIFN